MQEILNKLNEAVLIAQARVRQCDADTSINASMKQKNDIEASRLDALSKELSKKAKRLKDLQDVADAAALLKESEEKRKDISEAIRKEKEAFVSWKEAQEAEIKEKLLDIVRRSEKLAEAEQKLSEDKKNFRAKIIEEVHQQMNRRV